MTRASGRESRWAAMASATDAYRRGAATGSTTTSRNPAAVSACGSTPGALRERARTNSASGGAGRPSARSTSSGVAWNGFRSAVDHTIAARRPRRAARGGRR